MQNRNKIDLQKVQNDDRRAAYRRPQTQAHRLSIVARTPSGEEFFGTFEDLSVGGASAKFAVNERAMRPGDTVTLIISSLTRPAKVISQARVICSSDSPGGRLCGFQFTEPAALLKQIDSFYARFFNRRKSPRVGVPLDKKIIVQLLMTGGEIKSELIDMSIHGMQVRAPRALVKELDGCNHVSLRFKLPNRNEEISGRGAILRRVQSRDMVTLGLAFDLLQEQGISKHTAALNSWLVHRANEISKWDSSLTKPNAA